MALVAYSNEAKTKILKVPGSVLSKYGAVSAQTAIAMTKGVRNLLKTDFGIGITGIAGPTGGTKNKPVGLVYIAVRTDTETLCLECQFQGSRRSIKSQATTQALRLLHEFLD
jgi:PncC family amidohydrolase